MNIRISTKQIIIPAVLLCSTLFNANANAKVNQDKPPFSLTLAQVKAWSPTSTFADPKNVSATALESRFVSQLDEKKPALDKQVKLLLAPDGMNNLANYIEPQNKFNLYNFTHWSYVDVLNWFTGAAAVNIPARPWVEAAHKNGVKVIGTVFFAPAVYGGKADTVATLLEMDEYGRFPYADKLVEIANYYGFDGWLMNQETDLTFVKNADNEIVEGQFDYQRAAKLAKKMQRFMAYLTKAAPEHMEVHWYDSMLLDGSVKWQNQLNDLSSPFFEINKSDGVIASENIQGRISDSIFLNYWWDADMVENSVKKINQLNRSAYDMYFGADLWPERNAQRLFQRRDWLDTLFNEDGTSAQSSIALFANNASFIFSGSKSLAAYSNFQNDSKDYLSYYQSEVRLFSGDDLNVYHDDEQSNWPGLGRYIPAKSTLSQLPFATSFNTGHGKLTAHSGKLTQGEWHDVAQQDILPTWQFAIQGNETLSVFYDFEQAYHGGSSLAIRGDLRKGSANIPLYQTAFTVRKNSKVEFIAKQAEQGENLSFWLLTAEDEFISLAFNFVDNKWRKHAMSLAEYDGKIIKKIGVHLKQGTHPKYSANIGYLSVQ